jgi:DNA-binding NarL/FixJ family response regulator
VATKGLRVLVVEDEALIRLELEDMLADLGCEIAGSAGNLDAALTLADQVTCDLAILDINLANRPVKPVADRLEARGIPFLFTTGYPDHGHRVAHSRAPLLEKPYTRASLGAVLSQLVPP